MFSLLIFVVRLSLAFLIIGICVLNVEHDSSCSCEIESVSEQITRLGDDLFIAMKKAAQKHGSIVQLLDQLHTEQADTLPRIERAYKDVTSAIESTMGTIISLASDTLTACTSASQALEELNRISKGNSQIKQLLPSLHEINFHFAVLVGSTSAALEVCDLSSLCSSTYDRLPKMESGFAKRMLPRLRSTS